MKVNYLIATWAGNRHTSKPDYLKVHVNRLFELKHNIDQVTIIRPLGSDNDDFYDIGEDLLSKVTIINRPANDRSYGQFIYAYQQYTDQFDYYIIVEDDYCPNIDHFDSILIREIEEKGVDYLCGKWGTQSRMDPPRCIMNQGIVKASAFKNMLEKCDPVFPPMGPADGTEQQIFSDYFTNNGLTIGDYSDKYPVIFWSKTIMYFTKHRGLETIFTPYQCVSKNIPAHFLSPIQYRKINNGYLIEDPGVCLYPFTDNSKNIGFFNTVIDNENRLFITDVIFDKGYENLDTIIFDRISWENRSENLYLHIDKSCSTFNKLKELNWIVLSEEGDIALMMKDCQNW